MQQLEPLIPVFDGLCPMHVLIDGTGHISHVGPTLQKLRPDTPLAGMRFLELFELRRPRSVENISDLLTRGMQRLNLRFRDGPGTALKGVMVPLAPNPLAPNEEGAPAGAVVNLSFGISILDAVCDYELSAGDFPATDLTIEMLYLVEAKSMAMAASRDLNVQLQSAMIAAEEKAFTDALTGLKNRRAMDHVLAQMIASGRDFALMHVDLDFFKAVNDTMGHAAGDYVLAEAARIMVDQVRSDDTVARVGGDEFVLLFDGLVDQKSLDEIARRLIDNLERPIPFGDVTAQISGSAGTVLSTQYVEPEAAQMLADADLALYASKHKGRGCHSFFEPGLRDDSAAVAGTTPIDRRASGQAATH